ncbi:alpha/beta fold hydrolase [Pseudonocardia dioxanivorans]|uniref:alpha/beta fold hydrolase n=1 Tax=Pseudonocardia dioxanivorans TaxID=240495 RepID=UPI000A05D979|nr:alpha/beta hydrolase [Pseudonocardia dioxanivorans]
MGPGPAATNGCRGGPGGRIYDHGRVHVHPGRGFVPRRVVVAADGPAAAGARPRGVRAVADRDGRAGAPHDAGRDRARHHVDDVLAVVDAEELTDVVLVGHSYAGVVVGSVVDRRPEPFRRVVYLDALVPEDGRSVIDLLGPAGGYFLDRADEEAGVIPLDEESLDRWGLVRPADRDWVRRRASPQPLATFTDAAAMSRAVEASGVPVTYVYCTVKPRVDLFTAIAERTKADPAWDHVALAGPHDCMITHPVETADVLAAL